MAYANTPLSDFLPYVLPHVPGCPEPVAEFQLRLAAIEFCERTRCWRHTVQVEVSQNNRTASAPAFSTIHEFEAATFNGSPLIPTSWTESEPTELTGQDAPTGMPKFITQISPGLVSIMPLRAGTLRLSLFLKPSNGNAFGIDPADPFRDANNVVPAFMLAQHADALAQGALSRLHELPNEAFTNPQKADLCRMRFNRACDTAHAASLKGQQRAPLRTKTHWM